MDDYKNILGGIAVAISLASYLVYFWTIYKGYTKPHGFTWFVWGTLSAVGLGAVWVSGGGSGTWVIAVNMLAGYTVAGIAFYQKRVIYDLYDWLALTGAFLGIVLWWMTSNPFYAVLLVSASDAIGAIPTIRKAYRLPFEENPHTFILGVICNTLALFAMTTFSPSTALYQLSIVVVDITIVSVVYYRRKITLINS